MVIARRVEQAAFFRRIEARRSNLNSHVNMRLPRSLRSLAMT